MVFLHQNPLKGAKLNNGEWLFTRFSNETTLQGLLTASEIESMEGLLKTQSEVVLGLEARLALLHDGWYELVPREVHPEFVDLVWEIVSSNLERTFKLRLWSEACFKERAVASHKLEEAKRSRNQKYSLLE